MIIRLFVFRLASIIIACIPNSSFTVINCCLCSHSYHDRHRDHDRYRHRLSSSSPARTRACQKAPEAPALAALAGLPGALAWEELPRVGRRRVRRRTRLIGLLLSGVSYVLCVVSHVLKERVAKLVTMTTDMR